MVLYENKRKNYEMKMKKKVEKYRIAKFKRTPN